VRPETRRALLTPSDQTCHKAARNRAPFYFEKRPPYFYLKKCMDPAAVAALLRYLTLVAFFVVLLILVSDGLSAEDMSVIEAIIEVSNKKNVTQYLESERLQCWIFST